MSFFKYKEKNIYYEVYGEGEPIVILNGIMMSCISWKPFLESFDNNWKVILLDFADQGKSDKWDFEYDQTLQVDILYEFIGFMKLDKIHLFGISYGGEVALQFAVNYQNKLLSLLLSNTTSYTFNQLKEIGFAWNKAAKTYNGETFFEVCMPLIYSDNFFEKEYEWLNDRKKLFSKALTKEWYDGFVRLVDSAENYNAREKIQEIKVPTLIISADKDQITPVLYQNEIVRKIENSHHIIIENAGHAVMYEKPIEFMSIVKGFLTMYNKKIKL